MHDISNSCLAWEHHVARLTCSCTVVAMNDNARLASGSYRSTHSKAFVILTVTWAHSWQCSHKLVLKTIMLYPHFAALLPVHVLSQACTARFS